jgi:hypothetical protein
LILITAILAGILLGLALGGSLRALPSLRFRAAGLALAVVLAQRVVMYWPEADSWWPHFRAVVVSASYVALVGFSLANFSLVPMRLLAAGLGLNALVILANGGAMPVTREALTAARFHPGIEALHYGDPVPGTKDVLLPRGDTVLWPLSDVLVLPGPYPVGTTFSVGDVLIAAGAFWMVLVGTKPTFGPFRNRSRKQDGLEAKADKP